MKTYESMNIAYYSNQSINDQATTSVRGVPCIARTIYGRHDAHGGNDDIGGTVSVVGMAAVGVLVLVAADAAPAVALALVSALAGVAPAILTIKRQFQRCPTCA